MRFLILFLCCIVGAMVVPRWIPQRDGQATLITGLRAVARTGLLIAALFVLLSTSFVIVDQDKVGHLKRVYSMHPLPPSHIIALNGEAGPQAEILGPGLNFRWLINLIYEVEQKPLTEIPEGYYGFIMARDGVPLRPDQFLADAWRDEQKMIDAGHFLSEGRGQKGPQLTVLRPGRYRLNQYLFDVQTKAEAFQATAVPAGFVAVIKSNVQDATVTACTATQQGAATLSIPLVPRNCRGVWREALLPGTYYLNKRAYEAVLMDTRLQTWQYQGGYARRRINLTLNQNGQIEQTAEREEVIVPKNAADNAVLLRVEGWEIPQDLRVLAQVTPEDAPFVVASVGDLQAVEDKVITPTVRSIVRNVTGSYVSAQSTTTENDHIQSVHRVLDLQDKRPELEQTVLRALIPEARSAGVSIREVRFGDPALPPELLLARKREQLAQQMMATFQKEREAQDERIKTEKARATAEQQGELVRAEIQVEVAKQDREAAKLRGEGEKLRLQEIAAGQQAQASVLGREMTYQLAMLKDVLGLIAAHPEAVKVPSVLVEGRDTNASLPAAAAIFGFLGQSNVARSLGQTTTPQAPASKAP